MTIKIPAAFLGAALAAVLVTCGPATAAPLTADYRIAPFNTVDFLGNLDAFIAPTITRNGVTATGTGDLVALEANGLGAGGDTVVAGSEFVDFVLDAPAVAVSYFVSGTQGSQMRTLEAFGANGASLGVIAQANTTGAFDLTTLFAGAIISRFRLTSPSGSGFRLATVTWDAAATSTVPVPAALPLFAAGLAGFGALARRRKRA